MHVGGQQSGNSRPAGGPLYLLIGLAAVAGVVALALYAFQKRHSVA